MIENTVQPLESAGQGLAVSPVSANPAVSDTTPKNLGQILRYQLLTLKSYHAAVLHTCDVESVHKMRVTTRRLQASLDLLQFGKQKKEIKKVKAKLRKWRRKLSIVRNYDVFLLLLDSEAAKQKAINKSLGALKSELQKRRDHLSRMVITYLKRVSVDKLAARLGITLEEASAGPASGETTVANVEMSAPEREEAAGVGLKLGGDRAIARRAAMRIEQRAEEFLALAELAKPTTHPEELHQLRIAAKRLRYLFEIAADMGLGGSVTALNWLRSLQDRIGDWHDLDSLEDEILNIIGHREFMKERLVETGNILAATILLQRKRKILVSRLFPVKVHRRVESAAKRIANAFERNASTKL